MSKGNKGNKGKKIFKVFLAFLVALPFLGIALYFAVPTLSPRPENLGVQEGKLAPCSSRPNQVSSQSEDSRKKIEPFHYQGSVEEAREKLLSLLQKMPGVTLVTQDPHYLYAECRSSLFHFVDDIEFYLDPASKTIHLRGAARLGYRDFDVNRKRFEKMRQEFGTGKKD